MRTRFLITILLVLIATVIAVSAVHLYFFRTERLYLVDRQVEQAAAVLISSDFAYKKLDDPEEGNDLLAELLGRTAINLIVLLRDSEGNILFENENSEMLKTPLSTLEAWQFLEFEHFAVRVLTVEMPKSRKLLQVGLVLNQNLLRWKLINQRMFLYVSAVVLCILMISLALRRLLLRPLDRLAEYLHGVTLNFDTGRLVLEQGHTPALPALLQEPQLDDEFGRLLGAVKDLTQKIQSNQQDTRLWTAQMAHELKTPLTILRAELESRRTHGLDPGRIDELLKDLDQMAFLVDEFLEWSLAQNEVNLNQELHAIRLGAATEKSVEGLQQLYPDRISLEGDLKSSAVVFANPSHLNQVLNNLILNALKYSPAQKNVTICLSASVLRIQDLGPGIPKEVLDRLGKPFNRGNHAGDPATKGSGLGLAWASGIAQRYGWKLEIDSRPNGTAVSIDFESA